MQASRTVIVRPLSWTRRVSPSPTENTVAGCGCGGRATAASDKDRGFNPTPLFDWHSLQPRPQEQAPWHESLVAIYSEFH